MRSKLFISFSVLLSLILLGCGADRDLPKADTIFYGGDIITMEGDSASYVEALAVKNGRILFVGTTKEADGYQGDSTLMYDLRGETLVPAFIDAHAHVANYAMVSATAPLSPPPYGDVMSIPDLRKVLSDYIGQHKIPDGGMVLGNGYDESVMREHRHPTATELDSVSTTHPIYIVHTSGHMGVGNSLFMKKLGVRYSTPDPVGGAFIRDKASGQLTGRMIENANIHALLYVRKQTPPTPPEHQFDALLAAEKLWFKNGQTVIGECRADPATLHLIKAADEKGLLTGDFIVLPDYDLNKDSLAYWKQYYKKYQGHFKVGAIKMTFDGSPQGKSAWLTMPYLVPPDGEQAGFNGVPIYTRQAAYNGLKDIFSNGMQVHVHCNGDAAIDEYLDLIDSLRKENLVTTDMRNAIIHAQVCRPDQVPRIKQLNIIPSWFPTHCYLWGDWHYESVLGPERANHISPLKQGLDNGLLFTIHSDAPVTPPDLITAIYAAVNRQTRSGRVLGADQRIPAYEALKAITINAAYQWSEEDSRGSLKVGKKADLVILDKNLLKVEPLAIREVQVLATIKDGKTVYKK
ncbi:amidohydrolase [Paraflavitalea pollutisoli]|uniref:amidohydrolase n=1 Tax=Paraflavitalea pollutisoli TaxID=3034143 RepID=UPI0023ED5FFF|nr:amidohydrolase [Paraflavitalea sp. H1-2-19X]